MRVKLQGSALRETIAAEYAKRFVFGGLVTVVATLIANKWGPVVGGLFLAFPGIFPAGICLVEKHKTRREAEAGKEGTLSARGEASVEATGASAGAVGLAAFAFVMWKMMPAHSLAATLAVAATAWMFVSWLCWIAREQHLGLKRQRANG